MGQIATIDSTKVHEVSVSRNGHEWLDDAREQFCRLLVQRVGLVAAYKQAINPNVSDAVAMSLGTTLARVSVVAERVNKLEEDRILVRNTTKESLIGDVVRMYRVNACDYFSDDLEELKPKSQWTEDMKMACSSIERTKYGWKLTLYGKDVALNKVIDMLGFNAPKQSEVHHVNDFGSMTDEEVAKIVAEDVEYEEVE